MATLVCRAGVCDASSGIVIVWKAEPVRQAGPQILPFLAAAVD